MHPSSNPGEVCARQAHAHRAAVDDVRETHPLRAIRFVAQVETAAAAGLERHHPVQPQLASARYDASAADPRILVAVVTGEASPFHGNFEFAGARVTGAREPVFAPSGYDERTLRRLVRATAQQRKFLEIRV